MHQNNGICNYKQTHGETLQTTNKGHIWIILFSVIATHEQMCLDKEQRE